MKGSQRFGYYYLHEFLLLQESRGTALQNELPSAASLLRERLRSANAFLRAAAWPGGIQTAVAAAAERAAVICLLPKASLCLAEATSPACHAPLPVGVFLADLGRAE